MVRPWRRCSLPVAAGDLPDTELAVALGVYSFVMWSCAMVGSAAAADRPAPGEVVQLSSRSRVALGCGAIGGRPALRRPPLVGVACAIGPRLGHPRAGDAANTAPSSAVVNQTGVQSAAFRLASYIRPRCRRSTGTARSLRWRRCWRGRSPSADAPPPGRARARAAARRQLPALALVWRRGPARPRDGVVRVPRDADLPEHVLVAYLVGEHGPSPRPASRSPSRSSAGSSAASGSG
jgi:hypothetical protein